MFVFKVLKSDHVQKCCIPVCYSLSLLAVRLIWLLTFPATPSPMYQGHTHTRASAPCPRLPGVPPPSCPSRGRTSSWWDLLVSRELQRYKLVCNRTLLSGCYTQRWPAYRGLQWNLSIIVSHPWDHAKWQGWPAYGDLQWEPVYNGDLLIEVYSVTCL